MADKFDKTSIFDVSFKMQDDEGVEQEFLFKPLMGEDFVKAFTLIAKLSEKDLDSEDSVVKAFDENTLALLVDLETKMVSQSYPDLQKDRLSRFVASNCFQLIEPLTRAVMKVSKVEARRVQGKN